MASARVTSPRCAALCSIIPSDLLVQIAKSSNVSPEIRNGAQNTLHHMVTVRQIRREVVARNLNRAAPVASNAAATPGLHRTIYDCKGKGGLPFDLDRDGVFDRVRGFPPFEGTKLYTEGHNFTRPYDASAKTLYDNLGITYAFFKEVFNRESIDNQGLKLVGCVHYEDDARRGFFNALWFHDLAVFGDGDGMVFRSFGKFLDLTAHELTHGIIETTANLPYTNQAGALNESLADIFGSMVKQWAKVPKQEAQAADWLIARGLFLLPDGRALRDMANPGTAYGTTGVLRRDPQPRDMTGYIEYYPPDGHPITGNDYGGVHKYSGIPNRAFYLVATTLGGYSWDVAGKIWYNTMLDEELKTVNPRTAFKTFADLTLKHARPFGHDVVAAVESAWTAVKVYPWNPNWSTVSTMSML